jgi:hypothetical protein
LRRQPIRSVYLAGILLLGLLAGCDEAVLMKKMTPPEDEAIAKNYVNQLRQNQFASIEEDLDPAVSSQGAGETLTAMADMFPDGEPISVKVVGANVTQNQAVLNTSITLEYEFPQQWLIANVVTQKIDGVSRIIAFNVTPIPDAVENLNRFTFSGKGIVQYTVLLLAVLSCLIALYAFVLCIRTKIQKRKWLWLIATLIGVDQLSVVWTNAHTAFHVIWIAFPPAGAAAAPYGPWTVYVSLPLGALVFLLRRERGLFDRSTIVQPALGPTEPPLPPVLL